MNKSSNIQSSEYDADRQRLLVKFHSGSTYAYDNVPQIYHEGLQKASSPGTFLHSQIASRFRGYPVRHEPR